MAIAENVIDGFTITIEPNEDRDGVNCYVQRGRAGSSLAVVEDFGKIEPETPQGVRVPQATIDRIVAFAQKHGY